MAVKKIKLEQVISKILVADTNSESGDEASDFEECEACQESKYTSCVGQ
jgi:hypothetical protein